MLHKDNKVWVKLFLWFNVYASSLVISLLLGKYELGVIPSKFAVDFPKDQVHLLQILSWQLNNDISIIHAERSDRRNVALTFTW